MLMAVSKRLRFEILRRDGHTCRYCGAKAPDVALTVDHVIPEALGGTDDPSNLVAACGDCNGGKSSVPPDAPLVAQVAQDAQRWADAIRAAAERHKADDVEVRRWFLPLWFSSADGYLDAYDKDGLLIVKGGPSSLYTNLLEWPRVDLLEGPERPPDWSMAIARFLAAGLSRDRIELLVRTAMASSAARKDKWRYFCGCCWNAIRTLHEDAAALIRQEASV